MSLSNHELRVLAELEHDLEGSGLRAENLWPADRARRWAARCWGIGLVVVVAVSIVAPSVAAPVWGAVGTLLFLAGVVVVVSDGARVLRRLVRG